jgi:N-methylhydantoinase B
MAESSAGAAAIEGMDPVTFKIIKHRLCRVTDEMVNALKRVSGAPNTNEGHDLMVGLYTDEGDLLTGGVGFLHHYVGASEATKHVIDRFQGDIHNGDVFMLNDPYTAALHAPDVYVIKPIFYEGELRAFSASFVHVADIGAVDAGGFAPNATSVFHEGFQTPGLKLVDRGEMREDVLETFLNMSRDPGMAELDIRSQIAANNVADDRVETLFAEYGVDTVRGVGERLIAQSERRFRERLRELPDGEWEARQYVDSAPENGIFEVNLTLRKEGEDLIFDFAGTDGESEYGLNCTLTGTIGGVLAPVLPLLCHDMTWNDGIIDVIDVEAPSGTIVNAERPAPISIATVATLQVCNCLSTLTVSKMLGASEGYRDRATAVWHGAHSGYNVEVSGEDGSLVDSVTDTFAGAGGARASADGIDLGGEIPNLVGRWGNAERHEAAMPLLFLFRRFVADSGGPGEQRGGVGHEFAVTPMLEGEPFDTFETVSHGRGVEVPTSTGVFGGYPGPTVEYGVRRDVASRSGEFPTTEATSEDREPATWTVTDLGTDDVFYLRMPGSGGYGDPLERDPEEVLADVAEGTVSPEAAQDVYGVGVGPDGSLEEDPEVTRARRYEARLEDAPDHEPPVAYADTEATPNRLAASVDVRAAAGGAYAACAGCETVLAAVSAGWKDAAAVLEDPVSEAGPHREAEKFRLRRFVCPACGQLLDTEIARPEDPYLRSRLFDVVE